jgi:hypothetical protein
MVKPGAFRLLEGRDALGEYQWGAKISTRFFFCKRCGVHCHGFSRGRTGNSSLLLGSNGETSYRSSKPSSFGSTTIDFPTTRIDVPSRTIDFHGTRTPFDSPTDDLIRRRIDFDSSTLSSSRTRFDFD